MKVARWLGGVAVNVDSPPVRRRTQDSLATSVSINLSPEDLVRVELLVETLSARSGKRVNRTQAIQHILAAFWRGTTGKDLCTAARTNAVQIGSHGLVPPRKIRKSRPR